MSLILILLIGGSFGWLAHRHLKRCFGPVDDLLLGILGALLGASLVDLLELSTHGAFVNWLMTSGGAGFLLLLTNFNFET